MASTAQELGLTEEQVKEATLGGFFAGAYVGAWIGGMVVVEGVRAVASFPNDPIVLRLLVFGVITVSIAYTALFGEIIFGDCVTNFGNYFHLDLLTPEFGVHILISRLVISVSHLFFCHRVWVLSRDIFLTFGALLLAAVHLGISLVVAVRAFIFKSWLVMGMHSGVHFRLMYASALATDLLVFFSIFKSLKQTGARLQRTQTVINRILLLTFETSGLACAIAVVSIAGVGHFGVGYLYLLTYISGQIYMLSLLVTLNSRLRFNERLYSGNNNIKSDNVPLQNRSSENRALPKSFVSQFGSGVGVHVERVVLTEVDESRPTESPDGKVCGRIPVRVRKDPVKTRWGLRVDQKVLEAGELRRDEKGDLDIREESENGSDKFEVGKCM